MSRRRGGPRDPASTAVGLAHFRDLLAPGGVLAVIGLARSNLPADIPIEVAAAIAHRWHRSRKGLWEQPSPTVWSPPETYSGMRGVAHRVLPGARYRHRLLWRYSLM